jgi:vacuolar-type H+-ATPase subunit H
MELVNLLDQLELFIEDSKRVPFSEKRIIDADELYSYLDRIRALFPESFRQAERVMEEKQQIIAEAYREGERIIAEAKLKAEKAADEHEICKKAQQHAEEIIEKAKQTAQEIRVGSNEYAHNVLESLEQNLSKILETTYKGKEELKRVSR